MQQHKSGGLKFYIDLHGHVNKLGTFIYGNALQGSPQVENLLFARLLSLNSLHFDYPSCNFTEANMVTKDRFDGASREGCSRVAIYQETGLINCYTIEASYQGSKRLNALPGKFIRAKKVVEPETPTTNPHSKLYEGKDGAYTPEIFADMGRVWLNTPFRQYAAVC
jgi:hypothetical protein